VPNDPARGRLVRDVDTHRKTVTENLDPFSPHLDPGWIRLRLVHVGESHEHLAAVGDLAGRALMTL
jgi:hypothetical protein